MKKQLLYLLVSLFLFGCADKEQTNILYPTYELAKASDNTMQELFGVPMESIQLETSDSCLLGKIGKLVELENSYYALSSGKIYHFNTKGKHLSTLNRRGQGPGEYTQIHDFDLFINAQKEVEIWICDTKSIVRYLLKENQQWHHIGSLSFDQMIHKFHRIAANDILLMAGRERHTLQHVDTLGNLKGTYLEKSIPFLTFKSVQFQTHKQQVLFPLGPSNGYAALDTQTGEFKRGDFFDDSSFLSAAMVNELFAKYEYDFFGKLSEYKYPRSIRQSNHTVVADYVEGKNRYLTVMQSNGASKAVQLRPISTLKEKRYTDFLMTLGVSSSHSNYILFVHPFDDSDDNPCILKYDFNGK